MMWRHDPQHIPYEFGIVYQRIVTQPEYLAATTKNKIAFLRFAIQALKADIIGSSVADILYLDETESDCEVFPIQSAYFALGLQAQATRQPVAFDGNTVVALPYDRTKLFDAVVDIATEGYRADKAHGDGHYYPELKLLLIQNGRHHAAVAAPLGDGMTHADVYPLAPLFQHLTVNGTHWLLAGQPLCPVLDTRFALIYELARKLNSMER